MKDLEALRIDDGRSLGAPKLGVFRATAKEGDLVMPGAVLGTLAIVGRFHRVVVPEGVRGRLVHRLSPGPAPLGYGDALFDVQAIADGELEHGGVAKKAHDHHKVIRSPIHGVFYSRPAPEAPEFVSSGQALLSGKTVGLVEVMKTFHPVVYQGPASKVLELLVKDRTEVSAGQALISIDLPES